MKPKESRSETTPRGRHTTEKMYYPKNMLFLLGGSKRASYKNNTHHAPLNESHINLMQSWMNLRGMDCKLAETKYSDMNEKSES